MRKVSEIVKSQARDQFNTYKRKEVIKKTLERHKDSSNFQEILNTYKGLI